MLFVNQTGLPPLLLNIQSFKFSSNIIPNRYAVVFLTMQELGRYSVFGLR